MRTPDHHVAALSLPLMHPNRWTPPTDKTALASLPPLPGQRVQPPDDLLAMRPSRLFRRAEDPQPAPAPAQVIDRSTA